jgi:hypothetical protein
MLLDPLKPAFHDDQLFLNGRHLRLLSSTHENERSADYGPPPVLDPLEPAFPQRPTKMNDRRPASSMTREKERSTIDGGSTTG